MTTTRIVSITASGLVLSVGLALSAVADEGATTPAPKGVEIKDLDRTADPCTDFYAFANGAWRAANPIPTGAQRFSRRIAARETNRQQLVDLLKELAARADRPRGSIEQQVGDHFAACMNESAIDAAGLAPLAPWLKDIAQIEDGADLTRVIRGLHELAVPAPFVMTGASAYHDPALVVVNIAAGGLGLPDRDHYLKVDAHFVEVRARYREHLARTLTLAGLAAEPASQAADGILALETRLAEASLAPAAAADPSATAHRMTFTQLSRLAPRFDWASYFAEAGLAQLDVNVAEPAFLEHLNSEFESTPLTVWRPYLTWHVLKSAAPWLGQPFAEESFAFNDQYLGGAATMAPRAGRCLESTEALFGEPLGRIYAERYFPAEAKAKVLEMSRTLRSVLKQRLGAIAWMAESTRQQALAKVEAYDVKVGYPDVWTDYSAVVVERDAFFANVAAARRFGVAENLRHVGQRTSRALWQLPPSSPSAYIDIQLNLMVLPAGFLQPWAFDLAASDAVNYGAIGAGIAHDITHAIDALGADFDAEGQPHNWWTEPDRAAFQKLGQCSVEQYEGYEIEPGVSHQGARVLGEALGDLAGVQLAFEALERSMRQKPVPLIDGLSPEQQFFVAWGQFRGITESLALQRQMVASDPHPTAKYRVIGPLANLPEFQRAFACKAGSTMVRPSTERCVAW